MTEPNAPDWALIRRRYEETDAAVRAIAADAGIAETDLRKMAKRQRWRRQKPRPFLSPAQLARAGAGAIAVPLLAPSPAALPLAPSASGRGRSEVAAAEEPPAAAALSESARRRLLDRLVAAISLKLEQLERRMTDDLAALEAGAAATATDHERETRAIGALIDNLGKITEIELGLDRPAGAKRGTTAAASDVADEAERCRRELAERLARLVEAAQKEA